MFPLLVPINYDSFSKFKSTNLQNVDQECDCPDSDSTADSHGFQSNWCVVSLRCGKILFIVNHLFPNQKDESGMDHVQEV